MRILWYLACIPLVVELTFIQHEPYTWTKTARREYEGIRIADIWLDLAAPCKLFNIDQTNPIPFEYSQERCFSDYQNKLIKPLKKLCAVKQAPAHKSYLISNRPKRAVFIAAGFVILTASVIAGISSAITKAITEKNFENTLKQMKQDRNNELLRLEKQLADIEAKLGTVDHKIGYIQDRILKLDLKINVKTFFDRAQTIIDHERENWLTNQYSMAVLDLFNVTSQLGNSELVKEVLNCNMDTEKEQVYFEVELAKINTNLLYMEIDPFILYEPDEQMRKICNFEYSGPRFLKFNATAGSACLLSAQHSNMCLTGAQRNTFSRTTCEQFKHRSDTIQIKETAAYFVIYCRANNIKIGASAAQRCPVFPFRIQKEESFSLPNIKYEGKSLQIREKLDYASAIEHRINQALPTYILQQPTTEGGSINKEPIHVGIGISSLVLITLIACTLAYWKQKRSIPHSLTNTNNDEPIDTDAGEVRIKLMHPRTSSQF